LHKLASSTAHTDCSTCDSASASKRDDYTSAADDCAERGYSHGPSAESKHEHFPGESKHDAADQSDWASDTDYHQGGRGGNRERSSANKRRDSDTDWGSADSDAADSCARQWPADESRAASCPCPAMRERLGCDNGE
jgi:hypothetical protein